MSAKPDAMTWATVSAGVRPNGRRRVYTDGPVYKHVHSHVCEHVCGQAVGRLQRAGWKPLVEDGYNILVSYHNIFVIVTY